MQTRAKAKLTADRIVGVLANHDNTVLTLTQGGHLYTRVGDEPGVVLSQGQTAYLEVEVDHVGPPSAQPPAPSSASSTAASKQQQPKESPRGGASHGPAPTIFVPEAVAKTSAAAHLKGARTFSEAAARAIEGADMRQSMRDWHLADIRIYDPANPPKGIKKTRGSRTRLILDNGLQVKEQWRCRLCNALRTMDPSVTNNLITHSKQCPAKENNPM
ncbi:hypothetical protein OC835_004307 [Tilletia horrida]|nr:hypothetical protein OC835_004307 [Tilletia horrida]KAK0554060.1 hypothetical protein OC844_006223 [Tilletia horrida]